MTKFHNNLVKFVDLLLMLSFGPNQILFKPSYSLQRKLFLLNIPFRIPYIRSPPIAVAAIQSLPLTTSGVDTI